MAAPDRTAGRPEGEALSHPTLLAAALRAQYSNKRAPVSRPLEPSTKKSHHSSSSIESSPCTCIPGGQGNRPTGRRCEAADRECRGREAFSGRSMFKSALGLEGRRSYTTPTRAQSTEREERIGRPLLLLVSPSCDPPCPSPAAAWPSRPSPAKPGLKQRDAYGLRLAAAAPTGLGPTDRLSVRRLICPTVTMPHSGVASARAWELAERRGVDATRLRHSLSLYGRWPQSYGCKDTTICTKTSSSKKKLRKIPN